MEHTGRRNKKIRKLKPNIGAAKNEAVNALLLNAMTNLETIQQQENLGYLCTYTVADYIKGTQKWADETGAEKNQHLVELLKILKQTTELY